MTKTSPKKLLIAAALWLAGAQAVAAPSVRPEVGEPLQAAQQALQSRQYKDALARIAQAEKVGGLSAYESYLVARLRAAAAQGAGDYGTAVSAYETALASPEFPAAEKLQVLDALAKLAYAAKKYAKAADAIQAYQAAGGSDAKTLGLLPQALYLSNDFAGAQKVLNAQLSQMEKAGQTPTETQLQLLASCALKQNDTAGYVAALEKLVRYHPQESYWLDLLTRTVNKPGFSDKLALDVYRLRLHTGTLRTAADYMEAAQLALQAGLPGEAEAVVKQGYEKKLLGTGTPQEVDRHKRLADLVARKIAEDKPTLAEGEQAAAAQAGGDALVATGMNYVGYGDYEKGIALIRQGIAKGGLKRADQAKLQLGYAQLVAGRKDEAVETFSGVKGSDGSADLARLWLLQARS